MSRVENLAPSRTLRITISAQSEEMLTELGRRGIYGRSVADVAGRFVDQALQRLVRAKKLVPPPGVRPPSTEAAASEEPPDGSPP
jgi:hypothetical protein